jgi:hypothetical protein
MSAGETIKVESPMGFYHSPTGVLLSHMRFNPHSIKMGDKNYGRFRKNKELTFMQENYYCNLQILYCVNKNKESNV